MQSHDVAAYYRWPGLIGNDAQARDTILGLIPEYSVKRLPEAHTAWLPASSGSAPNDLTDRQLQDCQALMPKSNDRPKCTWLCCHVRATFLPVRTLGPPTLAPMGADLERL